MSDSAAKFPCSETAILACVDSFFPGAHQSLLLGRGDDCAIFNWNPRVCVSHDLFIEDVHFRRSYFEPQEVGYKALAVNISDLAAMGAKPVAFTLGLALPDWIDMGWLGKFFAGMSELAQQEDMALAGGDLSRADKMQISITVFGVALEGLSLMARGGSIPGDTIFIIGLPGLARTGLRELETGGRAALKSWPNACAAHLRPKPLTQAALMLARVAHNSRPPALMDVSDGLALDLRRLLGHGNNAGGLGATITLEPGLLHEEVLRSAAQHGLDPVIEALRGGEDYALLGSCAPDMASILRLAIPGFHNLGTVTEPGPIFCNGQDMTDLPGFDHFGGKNE